jgi:hypothetical protein
MLSWLQLNSTDASDVDNQYIATSWTLATPFPLDLPASESRLLLHHVIHVDPVLSIEQRSHLTSEVTCEFTSPKSCYITWGSSKTIHDTPTSFFKPPLICNSIQTGLKITFTPFLG